jgi:hypothetical protein
MRVKRRFAQSQPDVSMQQKRRLSGQKPAKYSVNTGDLATGPRRLHNFRVTGLCMSCTPLMNKQLELHEFR